MDMEIDQENADRRSPTVSNVQPPREDFVHMEENDFVLQMMEANDEFVSKLYAKTISSKVQDVWFQSPSTAYAPEVETLVENHFPEIIVNYQPSSIAFTNRLLACGFEVKMEKNGENDKHKVNFQHLCFTQDSEDDYQTIKFNYDLFRLIQAVQKVRETDDLFEEIQKKIQSISPNLLHVKELARNMEDSMVLMDKEVEILKTTRDKANKVFQNYRA